MSNENNSKAKESIIDRLKQELGGKDNIITQQDKALAMIGQSARLEFPILVGT